MAEHLLATLRLGGVVVAEYDDGARLDPVLAPRPYLHPVRTLDGRAVTDALPADHPWHLGISIGVQDVGGTNLWGGPTYVRGRGYTACEDHGRIEHAGFSSLADDGFDEALRWLAVDGRLLLGEHRRVRARLVAGGWELQLTTALTNATGADLALGSPATHGRAGAGYGGFSWRLPATREPFVHTTHTAGEQGTHGAVAPWLAWSDRAAGFTVVVTGADDVTRADPWFVRVGDYPGIGSQLAPRRPVTLAPGRTVTRGFRALVADGEVDDAVAARWAGSSGGRAGRAPAR